MAKKKHKGHYCKVCGEYKSNESFSGKGHVQHICKKCMSNLKKGNKNSFELPFDDDNDDDFQKVTACEKIASLLFGNDKERETKNFNKLNREQKMTLKMIAQNHIASYWRCYRLIPANNKLKELRNTVNSAVYDHFEFSIKDDTMFKAYFQDQVIAVINKILQQENQQTIM